MLMARRIHKLSSRGKLIAHVFTASTIGVAISIVLFWTVFGKFEGSMLDELRILSRDPFLAIFMFALIPLMVAIPLILMALVVTAIFWQSIERYPAIWCLIAPPICWLVACASLVFLANNQFFRAHTFFEGFAVIISRGENLLFLVGPIPAAVIFYVLSRRSRGSNTNDAVSHQI